MSAGTRVFVLAAVLAVAAAPLPSQQRGPRDTFALRAARDAPRLGGSAAVAAVRAFYTFHLSHDMAFSAATVRRRAAWLAPDLLALCRAYFARPSGPDEVPAIDGDPFTDSQEYPRSFRVGAATTPGPSPLAPVSYLVPVTFAGPAAQHRTLTVVVIPTRGSWLIADVRYGSGPSLRQLLAAGP